MQEGTQQNSASGTPSIDLKSTIRTIPDFPKPGILFYDITPVLKNDKALAYIINTLSDPYLDKKIDVVVSMEARGFIFGPAIAYKLGAGFAPLRKTGKLPWETQCIEYDLEYGTDKIEIHQDAVKEGERVLIIDDVLATGGTAGAVSNLIKRMNGEVVGAAFLIELMDLQGRNCLKDVPVFSVLQY